jgi:hypothetical protein
LLKQIGGNNKTLENEYFVMSHWSDIVNDSPSKQNSGKLELKKLQNTLTELCSETFSRTILLWQVRETFLKQVD